MQKKNILASLIIAALTISIVFSVIRNGERASRELEVAEKKLADEALFEGREPVDGAGLLAAKRGSSSGDIRKHLSPEQAFAEAQNQLVCYAAEQLKDVPLDNMTDEQLAEIEGQQPTVCNQGGLLIDRAR